MKNFNVVKIDSKGRVLIPFHIRDYIGIDEGMEVMVVNNEKKEVKLLPLAKGKTAYMRILIKDLPGALASVMSDISSHGVDILMSQSKTIEKGSLADLTEQQVLSCIRFQGV